MLYQTDSFTQEQDRQFAAGADIQTDAVLGRELMRQLDRAAFTAGYHAARNGDPMILDQCSGYRDLDVSDAAEWCARGDRNGRRQRGDGVRHPVCERNGCVVDGVAAELGQRQVHPSRCGQAARSGLRDVMTATGRLSVPEPEG